jgi:fibronectin type 3 domain-containing protein
VHVQVGVNLMTLVDGDEVILHWCDDYKTDEAKGAEVHKQDEAAAMAAEDVIDDLPAVISLDSEEAIAAARAAYDALSKYGKGKVANYAKLVEAEKKLEGLKMGKTTVKASNLKAGTIKLTWTAITGAVKYRVYVATSKTGEYTLAGTVTGTTFTYTKGTVGNTYFFKVVGVNADGYESQDSNIVSLAKLPGQVKSLKAKSKKKKQVTLTWKKVTGAKKYIIYMSKNGKSGWKKVGTSKKTTFTYKKGKSGKKLYFKVQAVSASGKKGEFSAVKKCKVK